MNAELKFECPHCGQRIGATHDQIGMTASCPNCGQDFTVPGEPITFDDNVATSDSAAVEAGTLASAKTQKKWAGIIAASVVVAGVLAALLWHSHFKSKKPDASIATANSDASSSESSRSLRSSNSAQVPKTKTRGLHLSINDLEALTKCKFQPAPAKHGVGAKVGIHSTNRLIMITNGPDDNITLLKMCLIISHDEAEMADSRMALMLFGGIFKMAGGPEASKWISGKFKAANTNTKDFEPPSRMFDGIEVDTHSKVGIGVGYSASDGRISERTYELAFDVTISTPEFL